MAPQFDQNPRVVVSMAVASLRGYRGNARTHSKKQIRQIADSIQKFGFTNPVLISDNDEIMAGHGLVEAAKLLGRFVNRDARVRFTAYVPPGSIAAGRALAEKPEIACAACHDENLTGNDRCQASQGARQPTCFANSMNTATVSAPARRADQ